MEWLRQDWLDVLALTADWMNSLDGQEDREMAKETYTQELARLLLAWEDMYANLHNTNIGTAPHLTEDELYSVWGKEQAYDDILRKAKELLPHSEFYVTQRDMLGLKHYVYQQWRHADFEMGIAVTPGSRQWHVLAGMRVAYHTISEDLRG